VGGGSGTVDDCGASGTVGAVAAASTGAASGADPVAAPGAAPFSTELIMPLR
jgi:hypothetical protein